MAGTPDDLTAASHALQSGRWDEAAAGFSAVAVASDDPWAHEGLAQTAWWLDDGELSLGAREAAYRGFRSMGDNCSAARAAAALAYDSMLFGRGAAVGRGWLARSADLLGGRTDVPEAGWLAVRQAEIALHVDRDAQAALASAGVAQQVGHATGDGDLVIVGQALAGLAQVRLGDLSAGMPLLDAAAAAATAGDVGELMWMGKICCWLIYACQETRDLTRAAEWCTRVEEICVRQDLTPLFAVCRTQYASLQMATGDCEAAETMLTDVVAGLDGSQRVTRHEAVGQLGELRRRQGRLAEAEQLFRQAGFGATGVIGLARIRLAEGDPGRAWSAISELLRALPSEQQLERADALLVAVSIGVASNRRDEAQAAADELRTLGDRINTPAFLAGAAAAAAVLADGPSAIAHWQDAVRHFQAAGLFFDEAECRLELADCLLRDGDEPGAREQAAVALERLLPLAGGPLLDHARRLALAEGAHSPLTPRQAEVLRLLAGGQTNAEIATALQLSEHTVHRHVANIYTALGVNSRVGAAAYAAGRGMV